MSPDIEMALEECLALMRTGYDLEECLAYFPALAEQLRPLLSEVAFLRSIPAPKARPAAVEEGRQRMFAALEQQNWARKPHETDVSKPAFTRYAEQTWKFLRFMLFGKETNRITFALRLTFGLTVTLMIALVSTLIVSASSIPGDPLYGVKRTMEMVELTLPLPEAYHQQLQARIDTERLTEIEKLVQIRRNTAVEFDGLLEQIASDHIVVSGFRMEMTPQTIIEGVPVVGMRVDMQVRVQSDGQLLAQALHVKNPGPDQTIPTPQPSQTPLPASDPGNATSTATAIPAVIPPIIPTGLPVNDGDENDDDREPDGGNYYRGDGGSDDDGSDDSGDDDGEDDDSGEVDDSGEDDSGD